MNPVPHFPMNRRRFLSAAAAASAAAAMRARADKPDPSVWHFLDNGKIRLGVKKSSGAGIGWISASGSELNLLDHLDHGRLIQQSYYGRTDGSLWVDKPWRWNPVQGGDYKGNAAELLELTADASSVKSRTRPRNWAGGELLADCEMTQHIRLEGAAVKVTFGFTYTGKESHPAVHQEVPAVFINPKFGTLVLCSAGDPWTGAPLERTQPGWPNENRKMAEPWAAYVDDKGQGIGLCVPIAKELTCYRFGSSPDAAGACSYFAPLVTFAVTPGLKFEYEALIALGSTEEIRAAFQAGRAGMKVAPLPGQG